MGVILEIMAASSPFLRTTGFHGSFRNCPPACWPLRSSERRMVGARGIEPPLTYVNRLLRPVRLPVPPRAPVTIIADGPSRAGRASREYTVRGPGAQQMSGNASAFREEDQEDAGQRPGPALDLPALVQSVPDLVHRVLAVVAAQVEARMRRAQLLDALVQAGPLGRRLVIEHRDGVPVS